MSAEHPLSRAWREAHEARLRDGGRAINTAGDNMAAELDRLRALGMRETDGSRVSVDLGDRMIFVSVTSDGRVDLRAGSTSALTPDKADELADVLRATATAARAVRRPTSWGAGA